MDDLVTWLQQQIDEDENAVRAMIGKGPTDGFLVKHRAVQTLIVESDSSTEAARLRLAECDSKRRIIIRHRPTDVDGYKEGRPLCVECDNMYWPCRTLVLIAAPYAERPGYREGWRP